VVARRRALCAIRIEFLGGVSGSLLLLDEEGASWELGGLHTGWTALPISRESIAGEICCRSALIPKFAFRDV
jgi:hypothetical protein